MQQTDITVPLNIRLLQIIHKFRNPTFNESKVSLKTTNNPYAHTEFARYGKRIAGVGESAGLSMRFCASRATSYASGMM